MQRRTLGYVTDSLMVFERVAGTSLARLNLNDLTCAKRQTLFRRLRLKDDRQPASK